MTKRKYGSKAAYQAERSAMIRLRDMTPEDHERNRNRERLDDEEMSFWMLYMGAALAGQASSGHEPGVLAWRAAAIADKAMAETRKRFCPSD